MPIAVTCPCCGDRYELSREMAGRRCRCKGCETVFRIPELQAAATTSSASAGSPFAGLDEGPALPRDGAYGPPAKSYSASAYEPELPPPPRAPKPSRSRPSRRRRDSDESDPLFKIGWGLMSFSLLMLVLPMIGLQWAIVNVLPPAAQALVFCIAFFVGGVLLCASSPSATWERVAKALGVALFALVMVFIAIAFGVGLHGANRAAPAPVIQFQPPAPPPPIVIRQVPMPNPMPNPNPMPAPPDFPRFNPPQPPQMPPMPRRGFGRPGRF